MRRLRLVRKKRLEREKKVLRGFWMKTAAKPKLKIVIVSLKKSLLTMLPLTLLRRPDLAAPPEGTALQGGGRRKAFLMISPITGWEEKA